MVFYFSATGNTQYAAQRLAQATGDYTVSIRECMRDGRRSFTLKTNENFGIVTPTYFQGMPLFLREFLSSLKLEDEGGTHYAYAVSTCGVSYGSAGTQAVRAAEKAGIHLDATFRIRMVDNWNPYFDMNDAAYIRSAEKTKLPPGKKAFIWRIPLAAKKKQSWPPPMRRAEKPRFSR